MTDAKTPDPREIQKTKMDLTRSPNRKFQLSTGNVFLYEGSIFTKSSFGALEHFPAGETMSWVFDHDEWQYILKGEAEVTYSLASTMHTEQEIMHVAAGDLYFIPCGARLTWKVAPGDDLLHLCVVMQLAAPREAGISYVRPGALTELE